MTPCELNLTVGALACAIANGKTQNEISLLSAFFTQLGDSLATIAVLNACNDAKNAENQNLPSAVL